MTGALIKGTVLGGLVLFVWGAISLAGLVIGKVAR